uniref:Vesicle transport through interaction with t-SNAREs 1B n=1 Tax=Cynoglossus semilaevis TaxID=244447 RepID=A0A3P8VMV7_CYNSE
MSSEEFEKLHEIYRSLYEELKLMPEKALKSHGEERKKLVRIFDERHGEAEEVTHQQSQRTLLLQGTESLNSATQSIERSHRIAAETEHIGTDIIEELGEQREQLDRARNRLVNTGENLSRSRKILRSMSRRLMTNKLLLAVIILMELAILGAVVYLKFFRR